MTAFRKLQQITQLETVQISAGVVTQGKATVIVKPKISQYSVASSRRIAILSSPKRLVPKNFWHNYSVAKHEIDTLLFIELGNRDLENGQTVSFSNTYQWRVIDEQTLSLSHLRHNEPTHLVDLVKHSDKCWKSKIPHHCGEDMYQATLVIEDNTLHLKWLINGPKKSIEIDVIYT